MKLNNNSWFYKIKKLVFPNKEDIKLKMIRNSIKRKRNILNNNLYINNIETKIKIVWLKDNQMTNDNLIQLSDLDYNLCFFLNKRLAFDTYQFQISFDIIIVNLSWQIVKLYSNYLPNNEIELLDKVHHIFVMATNSINALALKLGDRLCPMKKY